MSPVSHRVRDLGLGVGPTPVGPTNSIVDVAGVRVGHTTVTDGTTIFSGATAIVVDAASPSAPVPAGVFVGNGYGKFVGSTQVQELGQLETPIVLTSTLSVFRAADAIVSWVLREKGEHNTSINPVAGEVNDSWLSSQVRRAVEAEHVMAALDGATSKPFRMGNVGGGTGACALGFKGGIGSSSRVVSEDQRSVTVGALVQTNMDGRLRVAGRTVTPTELALEPAGPATADGSCMVVVAVDAPLDPNTLRRIAARSVYALARVGARFSHGSGDYGVAFSSRATPAPTRMSDRQTSSIFEATMDAVEEAVLDSLLAADTVVSSRGRTAHALPVDAISAAGASV